MAKTLKWPKYRIEADSLDGLAAKLVYLMKLENEKEGPDGPRIDTMNMVMAENSKVSVRLSKKPKDERAREGIEIDGARLG